MVKAVIFDMYETLITHWGHPRYFGRQIAEDAGIPYEQFAPLWRQGDTPRAIGQVTFEESVASILKTYHCYSDELMSRILQKRVAVKEECFRCMHPHILPMLQSIKSRGLRIGLVSDCSSEEATVIRQSGIFPYFDAVCLSCEEGMRKPDEAIFRLCLDRLRLEAGDCLYVGDGGSNELPAARALGMKTVQALWYVRQCDTPMCPPLADFIGAETPMSILKEVS